MVADILHRDVSAGNILILDENPYGLPNPKTSRGLLADWGLAGTKEELENRTFTQNTLSVRGAVTTRLPGWSLT